MRHGLRDVQAARQRGMFGVDKLERLVFDIANELLRCARKAEIEENVHLTRIASELLEYVDAQGSDWEIGHATDKTK